VLPWHVTATVVPADQVEMAFAQIAGKVAGGFETT
jgi:hypothetical protein